MSSTEKRQKQERERARHKSTPESAKRKLAASQRWIPHPTDTGYFIPSGKVDRYPEEINDLRIVSKVGGVIHAEALHALATAVEAIQLSKLIVPWHLENHQS